MRNSRSRSVAASYCRTPIRPNTMTSTRPTATIAASNNSSDSDVMTVASSGQQLESHPRRDTRTYTARAFILRQTDAMLHTAFPIPCLPPMENVASRSLRSPPRLSRVVRRVRNRKWHATLHCWDPHARHLVGVVRTLHPTLCRESLGVLDRHSLRCARHATRPSSLTTTAKRTSPFARESAMRTLNCVMLV